MAEAILARQVGHVGVERLVVLKRMLPHVATDPDFVQMFVDEARLMARLAHPNIVQVLDVGELGNTYFIALEYVRGVTLADLLDQARIEKRVLPAAIGARIVSEICAALHYAYQCPGADGKPLRVVHRDLSPQNIMVSFDGAVKLMDFGIAKAANQADRTRTGVIKGKVAYMSPEQVRGQPLDQRSDLFAAGIVLFEATTGQRMFETPNEYEMIRAIVEGRLRPPSSVVKDYPPALERLWRRATAVAPRRRFADGHAMQRALEEYLTSTAALSATLTLPEILRELFPHERDAALGHEPMGVEPAIEVANQQLPAAVGNGQRAAEFSAAATGWLTPTASLSWTKLAALGLGVALVAGAGAWLGLGPRAPIPVAVTPDPGAGSVTAPTPVSPILVAPPPTPVDAPASGSTPSARLSSDRSITPPARSPRRSLAPKPSGSPTPSRKGANNTATIEGVGLLTVTSTPWGTIMVDKKSYGETPIARVPLAIGEHEVVVTNPQTGHHVTRRVTIRLDQVTVVNLTLAP